jgi:hypothetical protein
MRVTIKIKRKWRTTFSFGWVGVFPEGKREKRTGRKKSNYWLTTVRCLICAPSVDLSPHAPLKETVVICFLGVKRCHTHHLKNVTAFHTLAFVLYMLIIFFYSIYQNI